MRRSAHAKRRLRAENGQFFSSQKHGGTPQRKRDDKRGKIIEMLRDGTTTKESEAALEWSWADLSREDSLFELRMGNQ